MKKWLSAVLVLALLAGIFAMSGCGAESVTLDTSKLVGNYDVPELRGTEINVYNWGEYVSDGAEGTLDVITAFEEVTGITVNYTMYDSNEDMYAKLKSGGASYDVVIPSDYMIARMIAEDMLQPLDFANIPNYSYIADDFKDLYFDPENAYSVPYTGGMVGLIYNTTMVEGTPDSWSVMWDEAYAGNILMFNNPRDAFGIAQFLLGQSVNTTDASEWGAAADKLIEQKPVVQSYVMDEVFDKMESGEAAIAAYYGGDYLTMADVNPDLAFVYPKEGTNIFVDSMCVPSNAGNKAAAELFINFMCEPEIALANAEYLCYLCPHTAVLEDERYTLRGNEVLYPKEEVKTEYFHNLDRDTQDLLSRLWEQVKLA
ncbi:MAG TPA: spermidine/putrescine ABC transporter substrate-binding protein [Candidatus Fimenecus excrementigallinarum]|uniref:Spermidine/putrescine ABC transporter substrate-binding protein n=1 Tax=Candidatus Fimenecus excrementigallinarum TaxID=2840816 RepID=A0A9D1LD75_9FIRM|nr:spermidine/putrescine ABC transporter substrate-binding protein [Candidatus Fimenecus excrementigallinarum]